MKKEYDFSKDHRGAVVTPASGMTRIMISLDDDVLAWFRETVHEVGGGNYQTLINDALREYISQGKESLEKAIRRKTKPRFTLEELVARMPKNNKVSEESFNPPVGREEW